MQSHVSTPDNGNIIFLFLSDLHRSPPRQPSNGSVQLFIENVRYRMYTVCFYLSASREAKTI